MSKVQLMLFRPIVEENAREPKNIKVIDDYVSLIWTDRFFKAGDFELVVPATPENVEDFKIDYLILSNFSKHGMFIETISVSAEDGQNANMTIKGRSAESILDRRIVWDSTEVINFEMDKKGEITYEKPLDTIVFDELIKPNCVEEETDTERVIPGFYTVEDDDDPEESIFGKFPIEANYKRGSNLYNIITEICDKYTIGFEILPIISDDFSDPYVNYQMKFKRSVDRTPTEIVEEGKEKHRNIYFTDNLENLKELQKYVAYDKFKNVALVGGEIKNDNEKKQKTSVVYSGYNEGLLRREMYVDASDIEQKTVKKAVYTKLLTSRGQEALADEAVQTTLTLDGKIIVDNYNYEYGKDYDLGDFVMVYDGDLGADSKVRIEEAVFTDDANGFVVSLGFVNITYQSNDFDDGILKYLYYYYDKRDLRSFGLTSEEDVIVVTGIRFRDLWRDRVDRLDIPVKWKEYYLLLDINQSGG